MAELGAGTGSSYPASIDTDDSPEVDSPSASKTTVRAAVPNDLAAAIVAVETTLGVNPQGTKADVKTFLQVEHDTGGQHKTFKKAINFAIDTGVADAYVIALSPAITALVDGQLFLFKVANANTGAATLAINGLGAKSIKKNNTFDPEAGDLAANQYILVVYDADDDVFQIPSPALLSTTLAKAFNYQVDAGSTDDYAVTLNPAITAYVDGQLFMFKANTINTGAATLDVNGVGAKSIYKNYNQSLDSGDIAAGQITLVVYDSGLDAFQLLSSTATGIYPSISTMVLYDDMFIGGTGLLGWTAANGSIASIASEANHPGIIRLSQSASQDGSVFPSDTTQFGFLPSSNFDITFIVRKFQGGAGQGIMVGLSDTISLDITPTNGIFFRVPSGGTDWFAVCRASSAETATDTTAALSANFVKLRMRRLSATVIGFTVDNGTEVQISTHVPTAALVPTLQFQNNTGTNNLDLDAFMAKIAVTR